MTQSINPDAHLSSILDRFLLQQSSRLLCPSQKPIKKLCVNPLCPQVSLICSEPLCPACNKNAHKNCQTTTMKQLTVTINKRTQRQRDFLLNINEVENHLFNELEKGRKQLVDKFRFGDLEQKYIEAIRQIYEKNNARCLKGKDSNTLYKRLLLLQKQIPSEHAQMAAQSYEKALKPILTNILQLRDTIFQSFSDQSQTQVKKCSEYQTSSSISNPYLPQSHISTMESAVSKLFFQKQMEALQRLLDQPKKIDRIFRASDHNFSIKAFHNICDNIEDTVVLVRTEFGRTVGGYTHQPWSSEGKWVSDPEGRSFIFSLDLNEKYIPTQTKHLTLCHQQYGPVFGFNGQGNDICIGDHGNSQPTSYSNFPEGYNRKGARKLSKNQQTIRQFSGASKGIYFRIVEWEVYKVTFNS